MPVRQRVRTFSPVLVLLGFALLPLLDSTVALAYWWRPEGAFEFAGILISFLLLPGMALLAWWSRGASRRRVQENAAVLVVGLLFSLVVLEFGAGYLNAGLEVRRVFHTRGPNIDAIIPADPALLPGITGPARFRTDRLGIRALAPPAAGTDQRWLAVGGSTTECVYLDDAKTWPWQTMTKVNGSAGREFVWIGNVGISGFDTRQHLRMLEDGSLLRGIDGLIFQPGINDLWRFAANEEFEAVRGRFGEGLKIRMPRLELEPEPEPHYRPLWARSRLLALFRTLRALRDPYRASAPEGEGGREYITRREARAAAEKVEGSPDWDKGATEYGERIRSLIHKARQRGLAVLFVSQPVMWQNPGNAEVDKMCWLGWRQDWKYWKLEALAQGTEKYNATLREVCESEAVPFVDLASMNGVDEYFYDDCHYTEHGAEAVASLVAPRLASLLAQGSE